MLDRLEIQPYSPEAFARSQHTVTVWRPTELSAVDGLDGLEGGKAEELDDVALSRAA